METTRQDLAEREREAGSLAERQSLAGEIHDTLAQGFATIVMHLEAAEAALDEPPSDSRKNLSQARDIARENLTQARRLVWTLKPDLLAESSLPEAVVRLAEQWSGRTGVTASVRVTGETRPLDPAIEVAPIGRFKKGFPILRSMLELGMLR